MQLFVETSTSSSGRNSPRMFTLRVSPDDSILEVTAQLYHLEGTPPHRQWLKWEGAGLAPNSRYLTRTLESFGIKDRSTLEMSVRPVLDNYRRAGEREWWSGESRWQRNQAASTIRASSQAVSNRAIRQSVIENGPQPNIENPGRFFPRQPNKEFAKEGRDTMAIFVREVNRMDSADIITVHASPTFTLWDLQVEVYHKLGTPPHKQRLEVGHYAGRGIVTYNTDALKRTLTECGLSENDLLVLSTRYDQYTTDTQVEWNRTELQFRERVEDSEKPGTDSEKSGGDEAEKSRSDEKSESSSDGEDGEEEIEEERQIVRGMQIYVMTASMRKIKFKEP